jgi:myo-inositol-1(or 4)-monophosphatase
VVTTDAADKVETSLFKEIEACAGKWAIEAGERLAARARGSLHIEYKGNGTSNPVSEADREAEEFLFREISHRFPDECVIGEEGRDPGPDRTPVVWVIDPLDGTTNYLNGLSLWCVSIGVLWYGVPIAGAIYTPLGPDGGPALFTARKAGGARMNGQPISVDADPCLHPARLSHLPAAYQSEIERRREIRGRKDVRTLGSIALELALTSCGALPFVAFWIPRLWDVAAGVSLILESNGVVLRRGERDQPWTPLYAFEAPQDLGLRKWHGSIVAANPVLSREVANRIQAGRDPFSSAQPRVD